MINHAFLATNDVDRSRSFYKATFKELGVEGHDLPHGTVFSHDGSSLIVAKPANGEPGTVSNGATMGLKASSYDEVDAWHRAGLANGGTSEGEPGFRENSPGNQYGAYLRDPDGNKVCTFAPNTGPRA